MSILGALTGDLSREQQLLRELNASLMVLQAEALSRTTDFGFSPDDVRKSRKVLLEFVQRLLRAIEAKSVDAEIDTVLAHIRSGIKPEGDWKEDLQKLETELTAQNHLKEEMLGVLEDILSLLDSEFARDLRRLYAH